MTQICPLCQVNSGRTSNRECCQIRHWASEPPHLRHAELAGIIAERGAEAGRAWKEQVHTEMKRLKGLR